MTTGVRHQIDVCCTVSITKDLAVTPSQAAIEHSTKEIVDSALVQCHPSTTKPIYFTQNILHIRVKACSALFSLRRTTPFLNIIVYVLRRYNAVFLQ